jgi:hypothetical protein
VAAAPQKAPKKERPAQHNQPIQAADAPKQPPTQWVTGLFPAGKAAEAGR